MSRAIPYSRFLGESGTRVAVRQLTRDPLILLTAALVGCGLLVSVVSGSVGDLPAVGAAGLATAALQAALRTLWHRLGRDRGEGIETVRLVIALGLVALLVAIIPDRGSLPLIVLYVPIITVAAAHGLRPFIAILGLAVAGIVIEAVAMTGGVEAVRARAVAIAFVSLVLGVGTVRTTGALRRTVGSMRTLLAADRRRARQLSGLEEVGHLLAEAGPTPANLDAVMGVFTDRFGYRHVSLHLLDGSVARLAAQRGYEVRVDFDGTRGVIGRVMRTHEPVFLPDVTVDPDYEQADPDVRSEICVPLLAHGRLLAILNVEAGEERALDDADRAAVVAVADRLAAALDLARERADLADRAATFARLVRFSGQVIGVLAPDELYGLVADAVVSVVPADFVGVTVLDRASGEYVVTAIHGVAPDTVGRVIKPGEGMAGRAIRDRTLIRIDGFERDSFPASVREQMPHDRYAAAVGVPLVRDGAAIGAISVGRVDPRPFSALELEALELLANEVTLAIANAFLHDDLAELAIRDGLTGLYNRRYFDEAVGHVFATRNRLPREKRPPLSAIMFDLDHFGAFNRGHGHQIGDEVLRTFASILRRRLRASDLCARYGGEEFIAILPGESAPAAEALADDIRRRLSASTILGVDGAALTVTVSAGCAEISEAEPTPEALIRAADVGLFMAKRAGRDRVVVA